MALTLIGIILGGQNWPPKMMPNQIRVYIHRSLLG